MPTQNTSMRAAIIGIGPGGPGRGGSHSIAYAHAWALKANGIPLVAAAARTASHRNAFASEFPQVALSADYQAMLKEFTPEVVSICAYPGDREAMSLAALENGARLLWIEKPLATDLGAAQRILAAAAHHGARVVVNHQRRYGAPMVAFLEAVATRIGNLISVDVVQPCPNLMDFGPHLIDIAQACFPAEPIRAQAGGARDPDHRHHGLPQEAWLVGSVHFADGTRLNVESGNNPPQAAPIIRANGTLGFSELHVSVPAGAQSVLRIQAAGAATIENPPFTEHFHHPLDPAHGNAYYDRLLADVLAAVQAGTPCRVDGSHALRGLEVLLGLYNSAAHNRKISWPLTAERFPWEI